MSARASFIATLSRQARGAIREGHRSGNTLNWEQMGQELTRIFEQAAAVLQDLSVEDLATHDTRSELIHLLLCGVRPAVSPIGIDQVSAWANALEAYPTNDADLARLNAVRGRIAMRLGDSAQALDFFERALDGTWLTPESSERLFVLECLLVMAEKRVDVDAARRYFDEARQLDEPDSHAVLSLTLNLSNALQNQASRAATTAEAEQLLEEARGLLHDMKDHAKEQSFIDLEVPAEVQLIVADHRLLNRWLDDAGLTVVENLLALDERTLALYQPIQQRYRASIGRMRVLQQPMLLRIMGNLAVLLKRFCQFEQAQDILETLIDEAGVLLQPDPILLADTYASLSEVLALRGDNMLTQALAQIDRAIAIAEHVHYEANLPNYRRSRAALLQSLAATDGLDI